MKKSILICLMLMGGVAVALSVFGHRDDVVRAAVEVRETTGDDASAPARRRRAVSSARPRWVRSRISTNRSLTEFP